ncbi:hypothetical protein KQI76_06275 [Amphibacillus sp. MSJ-3]|uniref:hypothetical protein n=1 Tax=Amphibacillus sp. MSJ-3 TaxID=2841505 RepID=UPI001C0F0EC5|nr:hypothetical protein [Amphibacillus sp. MSJ-3]MBU5594765.1 hypothetical protein [Amphibacillus sp. MSJ-3]
MLFVIISLLVISFILLIISFFTNDRFKEIENQIEQLSLSNLQDNYKIKQKLKVLEEELLPSKIDFTNQNSAKSSLEHRVENLYEQGYSIAEISQSTKLSEYDIKTLINQLTR